VRLQIIREVFRMAVESLRTNKMRSLLTVLGIVIGVMTVIGMVSVIQGLNRSFLQELASAGADLILVGKYDPVQMGQRSEEERRRRDLTFEDAMAIQEECPSVRSVAVSITADIFKPIPVKAGNITSENAIIIGMNENWPTVYALYLPQEGRFLTESEISRSTRSAILGFETAETLFPFTSAVGREIRIGPEKFTVVGVLEKRGQMFGQSRDNFVGMPLTTLMKYYPYNPERLEIGAIPRRPEDLNTAIEEIRNLLRQRRKVRFGQPDDFAVFTQDTLVDLYNQLTGAAYLVMIVISSIGLLVGGIGVMNIMLVSVKERTREIGIRKAIGARSADILKQFLIEAIFLTGTGGIIGVVIGFGLAMLVRAATPLPAAVSAWSVVAGLAVSISIGLFFGIFPAQKASRLDPIDSLRYE